MFYKKKYNLCNIIDTAKDVINILGDKRIILLNGDLGAGKTTFARQIIRILAKDTKLKVLSPTFSVVNLYQCTQATIAHFDCYRINNPKELQEVGIEEFLNSHICIIEWPEIVKRYFLQDIRYVDVNFLDSCDDNQDTRQIYITY